MSGDRPGDDQPRRLGELAERFCRELREGRPPSIEEYAAEAPELADEIREVFPALELLERSGGERVGAGALSDRIASRYGTETDPRVTLQGSEEEGAELSSEIVRRLSGRGQTYGRYQLKGEVARGGQGAVLRVWDEDLRRNLAMKVVLGTGDAGTEDTPPVDSRTLGRFLEEAQVTGQLDHPGIVPVHELGLDFEGRVYFTMKLVKGRDLKAIFDLVRAGKEGWTQTRALGVMLKACEAMAYAHSKRVIHRDLKPANVMVGKYGEVYVMDWGLARILDREDERDIRIRPALMSSEVRSDRRDRGGNAPDSPLLTMDGDVVGTPAYMSPEQAAGNLQAMGPHSDVYSAGAMLYHLLAGHMPYVRPGMAATNYSIWHRVQEGPPTPLRELAPTVPSELEAICEKAMARDTAARYADMQELAEDLRAFLEHRVVQAYETGAVAELRKWVARNKGLAAASAAAVLTLIAGLATSSSLYVEAKAETARATQEEATTERVLEFLTGMFAQQDPRESRGATITVKEVLDQNAARIEQELGDEPEIRARLLESMASLYHSLGLLQEAEPLLEEALRLWRQVLGEGHPATLAALANLALLYFHQGRYEESEPLLLQAFERLRAALGETHPETLTSLNNLAALYESQGRYGEAEPLFVRAHETQRVALGDDHPDTLTSLNNLAMLYEKQGRYAEAEPLLLQALEKHRALLGEDHPDTLAFRINLALIYYHQERYAEAESLLVQALEEARAVLGGGHSITLNALNILAVLYESQGRHEEAEPLLAQALEKRQSVLGKDHPDTLVSQINLGMTYHHQGRYAEAEPLLVQARERCRAVLSEDHPLTRTSQHNVKVLYRGWLASRRATLGESHLDTLATQSNLGVVLLKEGNHAEAEPLLLECLAKRIEALGEDHADTLASLYNVARLHASLQRWEEAEVAAGWLLELTAEEAEEYTERKQLFDRVLEAQGKGE